MNNAKPALRLEGVTRNFGGVNAVSNVTLEVGVGARHGIIGPNGAGKTTLFNMISGELECSTGRIELFGQDITKMAPARRVAIGLGRTYQITRTFPRLTVRENLTLAKHGLRASKYMMLKPWRAYNDCNEEVTRLAEQLQLGHRLQSLASDLSHGEQRQLEIALALALKPQLLLLDEPGAGLSPGERISIASLLKQLPSELTLIMIEHDMDLLREIVTWIDVFNFGQCVARGATADIQANKRVREIYLGSRG